MNNEELEYPAHEHLGKDLKKYGPKDVYWLKGRLNGTLCDEFQTLLQQRQQDREVMRELVEQFNYVNDELLRWESINYHSSALHVRIKAAIQRATELLKEKI